MDVNKSLNAALDHAVMVVFFYIPVAIIWGILGGVVGFIAALAVLEVCGELFGLSVETWLIIGSAAGAIIYNIYQGLNGGFSA
jgi:hypothetical protein